MTKEVFSVAGTAPAANLHFLISVYGELLEIPATTNQQAIHFEEKANVSRQTMRDMLTGKKMRRDHNRDTYRNLVAYFRRAKADLPENCLTIGIDRLTKIVGDAAHPVPEADAVSFNVPGYSKQCRSLQAFLPGTYITYRYAFEAEGDYLVSREVLHIRSDLSLLMSFLSRVNEANQEAYTFEGKVVPIGQALFCIAFNSGDVQHDRGRSLFFYNEHDPRLRDCQIGVLSGTRLHGNLGACAASTLIIRVAQYVDDQHLPTFIQNVTKNELFGKLIPSDFGSDKKRLDWLRTFLDNRPAGSISEKAISSKSRRRHEATLRIDRDRFNDRMPGIMETVRNESGVRSPFRHPADFFARRQESVGG